MNAEYLLYMRIYTIYAAFTESPAAGCIGDMSLGQGELRVMWQLVGDTAVRSTRSARRARDLKDAVGRELGVAPQWLEVSWRAHRLDNEDSLKEVEVDNPSDPVLVSLVLPRFARPCTEACTPRSKRHRVTNQAAVAALVWQPGLHQHELDDEDGDSSAHRQAAPSYPVYVSGIAGFPAPLLRLDLGCETPTVATLRKFLVEVTGIDYNLAFGGRLLIGSARQYLKRLCIFAGSVVAVEGRPPPDSLTSTASPADATIDTAPILSALVIDDELVALSNSVHCVQDKSRSSISARKRSRTPAVLLLQHTGSVWSGTSRKRMLSTGHTSPRGPYAGVSINGVSIKNLVFTNVSGVYLCM